MIYSLPYEIRWFLKKVQLNQSVTGVSFNIFVFVYIPCRTNHNIWRGPFQNCITSQQQIDCSYSKVLPKTKFISRLSVSSRSYRLDRTVTCSMWHNVKREHGAAEPKCGECRNEEVAHVVTRIDIQNSTGSQRFLLVALTPPLPPLSETLQRVLYIESIARNRNEEEN